MITDSQFYDLRHRLAIIEADNPTGSTFHTFDEGRGSTFIPEAGGNVSNFFESPEPPPQPTGTVAKLGHIFAFESYANSLLTGIVMEPGDIVLGPGCPNTEWIEWASILDVTTTPPVTATDCFVYLIIEIADGAYAALMDVGTKSAMQNSVTGDELKSRMVWPLVETIWTDGVITKVKNLQCGNIVIPRL